MIKVRVEARDLFRFQVDEADLEIGVAEQDLLAVGSPQRRVVEGVAVEVENTWRARAILLGNVQLVLAGSVGEVGDLFAVGRPRGRALRHAGGGGDVADVAFIARRGVDIAARFEDGPRACRREVGGADVFAGLLKRWPQAGEIARGMNLHLRHLAALQVVDFELTETLQDDAARPERCMAKVEPRVLQRLGHFLRLQVIKEERHRAVAVGEEVNPLAVPHGTEVVRVVAREFLDRGVVQIRDPDGRRRAAAIVFPDTESGRERRVGDTLAIGRVARVVAHRQGQRRRRPRVEAHGKERLEARRRGAVRAEENALAVRREGERHFRGRVVSEPLGFAAAHRHAEKIGVAVVTATEDDRLSVGREDRISLDAGRGGQAARFATLAGDDPQVARPVKYDVRLAERGALRQDCGAGGRGQHRAGKESKCQNAEGMSHGKLRCH